ATDGDGVAVEPEVDQDLIPRWDHRVFAWVPGRTAPLALVLDGGTVLDLHDLPARSRLVFLPIAGEGQENMRHEGTERLGPDGLVLDTALLVRPEIGRCQLKVGVPFRLDVDGDVGEAAFRADHPDPLVDLVLRSRQAGEVVAMAVDPGEPGRVEGVHVGQGPD